MKSAAFQAALAFVFLLVQSATALNRCVVKNHNIEGEGSLAHCLERADRSTAESYTIKISNSLAGETLVNPGVDFSEVRGPGTLVVRGPTRGTFNIDATVEVPGENRLPVVFFTGPSVNLDISGFTVKGGFECIRMAFDITFGGGTSADVDLTVRDFHCSKTSGSGIFIDENIGTIDIRSSSFNDCASSGINIEPQEAELSSYHITLKNVEASGNELWGAVFEVDSSPAGGTLDVVKFVGNNNKLKYGLEAIDFGEGRLEVKKVLRSTFNDNREGCEFINADVDLIKLCKFNGNFKYGLGLEQSHLKVIQGSELKNNGEYAFDTEALASIEELDLNVISGNALGTFQCEAPGGKRSGARAERGD